MQTSYRLNRIMQASIPFYQLRQILLDTTLKDAKFMAYLKANGYDDIFTKNPNIKKRPAHCTEDNTRFPWFDRDDELMVKIETIEAIEDAIGKLCPILVELPIAWKFE